MKLPESPALGHKSSGRSQGMGEERKLFNRATLTVLVVYTALNTGLLLLSPNAVVRQIFFASTLLTALTLFRINGPVYAGFTLWIWFLAPFVRRIIDYRVGWADPNIVILVPYVVTAIGALSLRKIFSPAFRVFIWPLGMIATCLMAGIVVGLFRMPVKDVISGTLGWGTPIIYGWYLIVTSSENPLYRRVVIESVVVGSVAMSIYGIYQFIVAPPWDCYWLDNVTPDLVAPSFGHPEPYALRIWSTINSPGTFSILLAVALILFLARRHIWLALPVALAFLLTEVRSSWMSFAAGIFLLLFLAPARYATQIRRRILVLTVTAVFGMAVLLTAPNIGEHVAKRFNTFADLGKDESVVERAYTYQVVLAYAAGDPLGDGINPSNTLRDLALDGLIQSLLIAFGWGGTLFFLIGMGRLVQLLFRAETVDPDVAVIRVAALVLISMAPASNVFFGPTGYFTWITMGLTLGALKQKVSVLEARRPQEIGFGFPVRAESFR